MNKSLAIVVMIAGISCATASAHAQERLGDGAMGALAGALVAGPIGLVAGGIVGYTAGPSIASSWGLRATGIIAAHITADIRRNKKPYQAIGHDRHVG